MGDTATHAHAAAVRVRPRTGRRHCRRFKAAELEDLLSGGMTADSEEAQRLRGAELAASKEEELLAGDLELLRQFASTNSVTVNGRVYKAK